MAALRVNFRLVIANPEDLRRGEARQRRVCRDLDQALLPDAFRDFLAFAPRALVAPDDGRAEHPVMFIEHHGAVAFGHFGKSIFSILKYLGVADVSFNQPKGMLYPSENPFAE